MSQPGPPPFEQRLSDTSDERRRLAAALWRLSEVLAADSSRRSFRARAYRRAVWSLDALSPTLQEDEPALLAVPGIGRGIAAVIAEFRETGSIATLRELDPLYPLDVERIRRLPRMTPRLLRALRRELGVDRIEDLERALDAGDTGQLPGVGPATSQLWQRILESWPSPHALPAYDAMGLAAQLSAHFADQLARPVVVGGQVRRRAEWVDIIDLVVATEAGAEPVLELEGSAVFSAASTVGGTLSASTHNGAAVRIHPAEPASFGNELVAATGPAEHVEMVSTVRAFPDEESLYAAKGVPWIPPPARGNTLEVATRVVSVADICSDLHVHSDSSPDGRMSLGEIAEICSERGYSHVLITDHTKGLRFGGLDELGLLRQAEAIDRVRSAFPELVIWHGAELNIEPGGELDIADDALTALDFAIAAVHSRFDLDTATQTARVVAAMAHPVVKVLAHPTGRRIGIRAPLALDLDTVFTAALEHDVALETNGHLDRLDLGAELVQRAAAAGVLLAANSDAHRPQEMANIENAVATLQRAGVNSDRVVNTWPIDRFREWVSAG